MNTQPQKHNNAEQIDRLVKATARELQVPLDQVPITEWFNPLSVPQKVGVFVSRKVREFSVELNTHVERDVNDLVEIRFPPNESVRIPSHYDRAIQQITCRECREAGVLTICYKTGPEQHEGVIAGGLAPNLQNRSARVDRTLHPGLNADANPAPSRTKRLVEN